jgi:hypothetical protein
MQPLKTRLPVQPSHRMSSGFHLFFSLLQLAANSESFLTSFA